MLSPFAALTAAILSASVSAPAPPDAAQATLDAMTLRQQVGQLFMVGTEATTADPRTRRQVRAGHAGAVILTGRSRRGVAATARVVTTLRHQVTSGGSRGVGIVVATDQEGGLVQVLNGPGFSDMPTALEQGRWTPTRLRTAAARWGRQLRRAGVDLDLAPVLDTVPRGRADQNRPIGYYHRELGHTPQAVSRHGRAFLDGLDRAGVAATVKHFPGLGRVRGNTDESPDVTDRITRRDDPYLRPFRAAIRDGAGFVMMSSARYARLDPRQPAAFSPYVVGRMLRGDLGFRGVVVSDDLAHARQVAGVPVGRRAVRFVAAGGDIVLTVDPAVLPAMYRAVLEEARTHPRFRAKVEASALRVLRAKQAHGLLR